MREVGGIQGGGIEWAGVRGVLVKASLGESCCTGCWGMGNSGRGRGEDTCAKVIWGMDGC